MTGNSYEYEIPWSGYYQLTIAGSRGGTYGATAGNGMVLTQKVWLEKGQVVSGASSVAPTHYTTTSGVLTVNGGTKTTLYIDGTLYASAAGGSGTTISTAPSGVNKVTVYNGNKESSSSGNVHWHTGVPTASGGCYTTPKRHQHSGSSSSLGGCYTVAVRHSHSESCYDEGDHLPSCPIVRGRHEYDCGSVHDWDGDGHGCDGFEYYDCGGHKYTKCGYGDNSIVRYDPGCGKTPGVTIDGYNLGCGYSQGEIRPVPSVSAAATSNSHGMSASASNTGSGYFKIQLCEHNGIKYGSTVKGVKYNNYNWNVVLNNDTVVFCKYGNLN